VLSLGINFAVQVLVVRYLSKEAYGAFVDAISIDTLLSLLLILIVLTPVQALDDLLAGLFCGHGEATCDLLRKHLLTPSFRLVVVIALILGDAGVFFLTGGYFIAAAVGVAIYASMLVRTLRTQGLLDHFDRRTMRIPAREMLSFTIPLLTTNLVCAVMAVSRRNPPRTLPGLDRRGFLTSRLAGRAAKPAGMLDVPSPVYAPRSAAVRPRGPHRRRAPLLADDGLDRRRFVPDLPLDVRAGQTLDAAFRRRYESSAVLLAILAFG